MRRENDRTRERGRGEKGENNDSPSSPGESHIEEEEKTSQRRWREEETIMVKRILSMLCFENSKQKEK